MKHYPYGVYWAALLGLSLLSVRVWGADDSVVVVLSSKSPPYQQALAGFENALGRSVPSFVLSERDPVISKGTRIIVAIGGKAALFPYPSQALLIYCLAPGTKITPDMHAGPLLKIHTSPALYLTILKLKELQPSLKRLSIIWSGDSIQDYIDLKKDIARRLGVDIISSRVKNPEALPDLLRALKGKADAIWMPADATMVTPKNFVTIKEFSLANGIPFYVPSEGLVEQGGTASVSASFGEIGALTAEMVRQALKEPLTMDQIFPEKIHYTVNLTAAASAGLTMTPDVIKKADRVIP